MGKRKKTATCNEKEADTAVIKPKQVECTAEEHTEKGTAKTAKKSKKTPPEKKQPKNFKQTTDDNQIEIVEETNTNVKPQRKKIKNIKTESQATAEKKTAKKVVFVDDESEVDTKSKKQNFLNDEEAAVKDEDIDKFCDEIDEEDNVQYESWIKLVEATLHPTKKKS